MPSFRRTQFIGSALALLTLPASSAFALNILLCNDDGITAANVRALKARLTAAGHRVVLSGPIANQSGTGGAMNFLRPIAPLTGTECGALASGLNLPLPGISLATGGTVLPSGAVLPKDTSPTAEANVIAAGSAVTVSPVQGVPQASERLLERLRRGAIKGH